MIRFPPLAIAVLTLIGGGCAAARPAATMPAPTEPHTSLHLTLAPPAVAYDTRDANESGEGSHVVPPRPEDLRDALLDALQRDGVFAGIDLLPGNVVGPERIPVAARAGADLILETRITGRSVRWVGRNGLFPWNLALSVLAWPVSWWVPDETYAVDLEVEYILRSARSGEAVLDGVTRVAVEADLDDFERGWQLLSIFRVPGSLAPDDWAGVARTIGPGARAELARELSEELGAGVRARLSDAAFHRALSRRFALVVGVSSFRDYRIRNLRYARADAEAFHRHLVRAMGFLEHDTRLVLDGMATSASIRSAIAELRSRDIRKGDEVVVYFAGYGGVEEGETFLLPADASIDRLPESSIPLAEIAALPATLAPARVTLVLDAPFVERFEGRTSPDPIPHALAETLEPALDGTDGEVLAAAEIGDACIELGELGHGLFTYYLLRGMQGAGDDDRDGRITWREATAFAHRMVTQHAQIEGQVQRPGFYRRRAGDESPGAVDDGSTPPGG